MRRWRRVSRSSPHEALGQRRLREPSRQAALEIPKAFRRSTEPVEVPVEGQADLAGLRSRQRLDGVPRRSIAALAVDDVRGISTELCFAREQGWSIV